MKKLPKTHSQTTLAAALGVTTRHSFVAEPFKAINQAVSNGETQGIIKVAGLNVPWKLNGSFPVVPFTSIAAFKAQAAARPQAGDEYLNIQQLANKLDVKRNHGVLTSTWKEISKQLKNGYEEGTVTVSEMTIPWKAFYSKRNLKLAYVPIESLESFKKLIANAPRKATSNEISITTACVMLKISNTHPAIKLLNEAIERQFHEGKTSGLVKLNDAIIPWNLVKAVWGGSSKFGGVSPHIEMETIAAIAKLAGVTVPELPKQTLDANSTPKYSVGRKRRPGNPVEISEKLASNTLEPLSNGIVTRWDVARALGVSPIHSVVYSVFSKLDEAVRDGMKSGSVTIAGKIFDWSLRTRERGGGSATPTLPSSSISAFSELMSTIPAATENHLNRGQLLRELRVSNSNRVLIRAWIKMRTLREEGAKGGHFEMEGETIHWQLLRTKAGGEFCHIHKTSLPAFRRILSKQNQNLIQTPDLEQNANNNEIKPRI